MKTSRVARQGILLAGCGKMGSAMLNGWLTGGLKAERVWVRDPAPSEWLMSTGVNVNATLTHQPAALMLAIKPQMMADVLPQLTKSIGPDTMVLSIAAGIKIEAIEAAFGPEQPIVRAMPNTPAAVGQGITAICANAAGAPMLKEAEELLEVIGDVVRLEDERDMDAVTGVSGSGPAYVFHLIETLAHAGEAQGLSPELSMQLAKATVAGAGALAMQTEDAPRILRENVTSPNGTTQAALEVLMNQNTGFPSLMNKAVEAATKRSVALSNE